MKELKEILEERNKIFLKMQEENKEIDEKQFDRNFLLALNDLPLCQEDKKKALQIAINQEEIRFEELKKQIYENFLLDIGEKDNIQVSECFYCYYDAENQTLSTKSRTFENKKIKIPDYRILGNEITWQMLVE